VSVCRFWKSSLPLEGLEQTVKNLTLDGISYEDTVDAGLVSGAVNDENKVVTDAADVRESADVKRTGLKTYISTTEIESKFQQEYVVNIEETTVGKASVSEQDPTSFGIGKELKTATAEQLLAAEGEERKTFSIKSVVNPADGSDISLQQAIVLGIIQPDEGVYVDTVSGERKPIPTAMSQGLIKVCTGTVYLMINSNIPAGVVMPERYASRKSYYVICRINYTPKEFIHGYGVKIFQHLN